MTQNDRDFYVTLLQNLIHRMNYDEKTGAYTLIGRVTLDEITAIQKGIETLRH